MLEILLVFFLGQRLGKKAVSRGLSKNYGWLILPFWIIPEFLGIVILSIAEADLFVLYLGALLFAGLGGALAFVVVGKMGPGVPAAPMMPTAPYAGQPAYPGQIPPPPSPNAAALRAQAGFCSECGETVWLTPNGACSRGHGPENISGQYTPTM